MITFAKGSEANIANTVPQKDQFVVATDSGKFFVALEKDDETKYLELGPVQALETYAARVEEVTAECYTVYNSIVDVANNVYTVTADLRNLVSTAWDQLSEVRTIANSVYDVANNINASLTRLNAAYDKANSAYNYADQAYKKAVEAYNKN